MAKGPHLFFFHLNPRGKNKGTQRYISFPTPLMLTETPPWNFRAMGRVAVIEFITKRKAPGSGERYMEDGVEVRLSCEPARRPVLGKSVAVSR